VVDLVDISVKSLGVIASRGNYKVPWLSRGVGCVMMRLSVLIEHRLVTDRQTYKQTDKEADGWTDR